MALAAAVGVVALVGWRYSLRMAKIVRSGMSSGSESSSLGMRKESIFVLGVVPYKMKYEVVEEAQELNFRRLTLKSRSPPRYPQPCYPQPVADLCSEHSLLL